MAQFEGEKNLNRETSELEVKGKFKLSEEELDNVAGGCGTVYDFVYFACPNCPRDFYWTNTEVPSASNCPNCDVCGTKMRATHAEIGHDRHYFHD